MLHGFIGAALVGLAVVAKKEITPGMVVVFRPQMTAPYGRQVPIGPVRATGETMMRRNREYIVVTWEWIHGEDGTVQIRNAWIPRDATEI